ncbi:MAG: hypothetical protein QNJ16_05295 [Rhodobacter sp.]|nr:hypothetical protein [Rhodobacter sp.]
MQKRHLIALAAAALPGQALAHGAHAPVTAPAHGLVHAWPVLAIAFIALAGIVVLSRGAGTKP